MTFIYIWLSCSITQRFIWSITLIFCHQNDCLCWDSKDMTHPAILDRSRALSDVLKSSVDQEYSPSSTRCAKSRWPPQQHTQVAWFGPQVYYCNAHTPLIANLYILHFKYRPFFHPFRTCQRKIMFIRKVNYSYFSGQNPVLRLIMQCSTEYVTAPCCLQCFPNKFDIIFMS